jgi:hypothetical protein
MYALVIIGLIVFAASALMRGVRTRRVAPLAVGSVSMLLGTAVMTLLSL